MDCVDHFEYKGYNLPLNLSKYMQGGSVVKGCVKKLHYPSSNVCDGSSHLECVFPWVVFVLVLLMAMQGLLIWHLAKIAKRRPARAPADETELEEICIREEAPSPRTSRRNLAPAVAAAASAVFLANGMLDMGGIVGVSSCSQVFPMGDVFETCVDQSCTKLWVYSLEISNGEEICVPTASGLVSLGTFTVSADAIPDFSLESSDWNIKVDVKRSCYGHNGCNKCTEGETSRIYPIDPKFQASGCFSKCGCVSCGCASCGQSCLFWKATVNPQGSRYTIERFSNFYYGVSVRKGVDYKLLDRGETMDTPLGKISVGHVSPHPMGKVCMRQDKMLDTEDCRPNMEGPNSLTYEGSNILFDTSRIHCNSPTTDAVRCSVVNSDKDMAQFTLPHYRDGYVVEKQGKRLVASYTKPLRISLNLLRDSPLPLKFVMDNSSCSVAHYEKHGCFSCEEGFIVLITMQGHGHCYFQEESVLVASTLISCDGSSYIHGFTNKHKLPDFSVCGQTLTFEGQLSPPKVMTADGSWTGSSEASSSWWEPLVSIQSFSLKTSLTTLLTCLAAYLGLRIFLMLKAAFKR